MPVTKNATTGEYHAALSDDSIDRDEEMVSPELIKEWASNGSLTALANHKNAMETWVGGWTDMKVVEKNGFSTLFAKPFFFSKSANPLAAQIEKQVEEAMEKGLNPGISIGAIVNDSEMRKVGGKSIRAFTKGELLEATWVPIQSNRNATYGHVAKKFGVCDETNQSEESKLEKEFTQKDMDSAVETKEATLKADFTKQLETKEAEITDLNKKLAESEKVSKEAAEKAEKELTEVQKALEEEKKVAIEKQKIADAPGDEKEPEGDEDVDKAFASGKVPIMRQ